MCEYLLALPCVDTSLELKPCRRVLNQQQYVLLTRGHKVVSSASEKGRRQRWTIPGACVNDAAQIAARGRVT